ncbi:hypothetical protein [Burkholderia gladioli]|uniref:hypothetical protein n=1 Tax=Burkholderia gladioli TaxID=28095 RepID=UPI00163EBBF3|nr:hypothetical protein [Burkholderia gladioli]
MKLFARVVVAALLTLPVQISIASLPWMARWFGNGGEGWNTLAPLFRALGSAGGEQNEDIFVAGLLLISFSISFLFSFALFRGIGRLRRSSTNRS